MANKKKSNNPNKKKKKKEPEIICPECEGTQWDFVRAKRRIPTKWQVNLGVAITCIIFAFVPNMIWFAGTFAVAYVVISLIPRTVIVGTCRKCGHEELFNAPKDGGENPVFGDDIYKF